MKKIQFLLMVLVLAATLIVHNVCLREMTPLERVYKLARYYSDVDLIQAGTLYENEGKHEAIYFTDLGEGSFLVNHYVLEDALLFGCDTDGSAYVCFLAAVSYVDAPPYWMHTTLPLGSVAVSEPIFFEKVNELVEMILANPLDVAEMNREIRGIVISGEDSEQIQYKGELT